MPCLAAYLARSCARNPSCTPNMGLLRAYAGHAILNRSQIEAIVSTMKIVHPMSNEGDVTRPKRRYYNPELKAQVVQQCGEDNVSIAAVALAHRINANIVHRWLNEAKNSALLAQAKAFIPVTLERLAVGNCASQCGSADTVQGHAGGRSPRQQRHHRSWPTAEAATCAAWLREWLQVQTSRRAALGGDLRGRCAILLGRAWHRHWRAVESTWILYLG